MQQKIFIIVFVFAFNNLFSQNFKGYVVDQATLKPVADCIVILKGTVTSVMTDKKGAFTLPVPFNSKESIVINILGYLTTEYILNGPEKDTFRIIPKHILLKEIEVNANKKVVLNPKSSQVVLDFDLLNDNILLLTAGRDHNYLQLLNEDGTILSGLKTRNNAESLKHDCLHNIQLANNDSVWQVFYDYVKLNLLNPHSRQTYSGTVENCICYTNHNYYFKDMSYRNLRSHYFFYSEFEKGVKQDLATFEDTAKIRNFELDYNLKYFLDMRRKSNYTMYNEPVDSIRCKMEKYREELNLDWSYASWLGNVKTDMISTDTSLFIVNFTDSAIYKVDPDNKICYHSKLSCFTYKGLQSKIYLDADLNKAYLVAFSESKLIFIHINLHTGKEISKTEISNIPYFPKKIIVNNGKAYYIQKNLADEQSYKVMKYYLN